MKTHVMIVNQVLFDARRENLWIFDFGNFIWVDEFLDESFEVFLVSFVRFDFALTILPLVELLSVLIVTGSFFVAS